MNLSVHADVPPIITIHPQELVDVAQGKSVVFTVQAIGTEPMNYDWQWKPTEEKGVSKEWQQCSAKWSDGATLNIPKAKKSHEGSYRCVVNNLAGSQTSTPSKLSVGKSLTFSYSYTYCTNKLVVLTTEWLP